MNWLLPAHAPTGGGEGANTQPIALDRESNPKPFGAQANALTTDHGNSLDF